VLLVAVFALQVAMGQDKPKTYTLEQILELMPRKPEPRDNKLAAKESQEWLTANMKGKVLRFTGTVGGPGVYPNRSGKTGFELSAFTDRQLWRGFRFSQGVGAHFDKDVQSQLTQVHPRDIVTIEGTIDTIEVGWEMTPIPDTPGSGVVNAELSGCKLISVAERPATAKDSTAKKKKK